MSELVPTTPSTNELDVLIRQAELLAKASIIPKDYQRNPGNVVAAALMGRAFGWDAMTSMRMVTVIQGTASLKPEAQLALIRQRGHSVKIEQHKDGQGVTVHGKRADTGDTASTTFTLADADRAGLLRNGTWKAYPLDMCQWRAISRLSRSLFGDVVLGAGYAPEEIALARVADVATVEVTRDGTVAEPVFDTETGEIVDGEVVEETPQRSAKFASEKSLNYLEVLVKKAGYASTGAFIESGDAARLLGHIVANLPNATDCSALIDKLKNSTPVEAVVTKVADPDDPWATGEKIMAAPDQLARLDAAYRSKGLGTSTADKELRLALASDVVGRPLTSARDLTRSECSAVITAIEAMTTDPTQGELA